MSGCPSQQHWRKPTTTLRRRWGLRRTTLYGDRRPPVREGSRAAGGSHGRLRGCHGASPLHTVAGEHCSRSSGRPHGEVPPPEDFGPEEEGGGGEEERGGEAAGGEVRGEDEAAQRQGPPRPAAH